MRSFSSEIPYELTDYRGRFRLRDFGCEKRDNQYLLNDPVTCLKSVQPFAKGYQQRLHEERPCQSLIRTDIYTSLSIFSSATWKKNSIPCVPVLWISAMRKGIPGVGWSRDGLFRACRLPAAWAEEALDIRHRAMLR